MTRRTTRMVTLIALVSVLLFSSLPVSAGGTRFWFAAQFDRSPDAVKSRFNTLSSEWTLQKRGAQWPVPPQLVNTAFPSNQDFFFYQKEPVKPMTGEAMKFTITGQTDSDGRVASLAIQMAPSDPFGECYLRASDQLMQLVTLSLFDELDEKVNRSVALLFSYDLKPFSYRDIGDELVPSSRSISSVIDGMLVEFSAVALEHDQLNLDIHLKGHATQEQIRDSKANDTCNRNLSQAHTECNGLSNCVRELLNLSTYEEADWYAIEAIFDQMVECITVIDELNVKLSGYEKSAVFAEKLSEQCTLIRASNQQLSPLIVKKDQTGIASMLPEMVQRAQDMRQLIWLIIG